MSHAGHPAYPMTDGQFQIVYDALSFTFASMAASTVFFWMRLGSVHERYKTALCITGLVTAIAAYHYIRIFNSWVEAYQYPLPNFGEEGNATMINDPILTGVPFNDAYRYMDWLLTVPLLLIEIVLVMNLSAEETATKSWQLGVFSALMIVVGYPGELILDDGELWKRWIFWMAAMVPFSFVVYTLLVGLKGATEAEQDPDIRSRIYAAQWMTVISWLTYPVVYVIPMMGAQGASAIVGIQMGYCISDIISKCGVGLLIYRITIAKSERMRQNMSSQM